MFENKAVVLGANYYIGLSIIRCLGREHVHVAAVDYSEKGAYGLASKYVSEKLIAPHYKEDPVGFFHFLVDYAKKQDHKPVLFPSADPYVAFVDRYLNELKAYYLIPQTEKGLYTRIMNKETLEEAARLTGTLVPETASPDAPDFYDVLEGTIGFPCLVKPTDSPSFVAKYRKKLFTAGNLDELDEILARTRKDNMDVIVQRLIKGHDDHMYTYDAYLDQNSRVTHWTTCQKLRQYPINYGASVYTKQRFVPILNRIGARFLGKIGWKGFAEIEFKKDDETGNYYLIEVNVRTTNLNALLYKVGLNFPYIQYRELIGHSLHPSAVDYNTNCAFWYAFEDLLAVRDFIKAGQLKPSQVLASYLMKKAPAIWDPSDPKPYFSFMKHKVVLPLAGKALRLAGKGKNHAA